MLGIYIDHVWDKNLQILREPDEWVRRCQGVGPPVPLTVISIIGFIGNIYAIRLIQKRFKVSLIDEIFLSPAAIQKLTDKRYENNM